VTEKNLQDLLKGSARAVVATIHTSMPGVVVSYDPAFQRAAVQPAIQGKRLDAQGNAESYPFPVLPNVPVLFPGAGAYQVTWPITPGDRVLLVFAERSVEEWKTSGGQGIDPQDRRRFDLSDAFAIPEPRPLNDPIPQAGWSAGGLVVRGAQVLLGGSAAAQGVARIGDTVTIDALAVSALAAQMIAAGLVLPGVPVGPPPGGIQITITSGSAKVKAE
jgi:hypothetical protein